MPVKFKPDAGIFNKLGIMFALAKYIGANFVCIEDYQILTTSFTDLERAGVINIKNQTDSKLDYYYISILASLLCDTPNPQTDMLERMLTAGYLLRNSLEKNSSLVTNLKSILSETN
jgi:hypothetical protein